MTPAGLILAYVSIPVLMDSCGLFIQAVDVTACCVTGMATL